MFFLLIVQFFNVCSTAMYLMDKSHTSGFIYKNVIKYIFFIISHKKVVQ